jgi:UDP-N-acetylmuramoyl-L-alanyl-D-glutamate--2,6-diaminopimelate ligase
VELPVKLKTLFKNLPVVFKGPKEVTLTGLSSDSRTVAPGNLFIAKRGLTQDGAQFIGQALQAGAAAVLTDLYDPFLSIPQIIHPRPVEIEAALAARYYENPSHELFTIGVTGTKGKTTTTYLLHHFLNAGLIGTVETIIGDHRSFSTHTTHDIIYNQKALREMVHKGCKSAVLEVSSHALDQNRVDEIRFELGIFTNLYPDHLDYHKTMENYAASKRKLFERAKKSILNADSPWKMGTGLTYGIEQGDLRATKIALSSEGTQFEIEGERFFSPLIGKFNVYNALAAIAAALEEGMSLSACAEKLASFPGTPARLERIGNVFIDFAHTGEALENVLQTLKEISKGKVIVVFGCGGNRDPQRRIKMGQAAAKWADASILTSDNPRQEDPAEIARQIASAYPVPPLIELDRKKAIHLALSLAKPDDLILIAGKGHEKVQIFATHQIPFDDFAVAKEALQNLSNSATVVGP